MNSKKLPPIDFKEEVDNFKAYQENTDVKLNKCSHENIKVENGEIRCACGSAWSGPGIERLYQAMKNR